jgi:undecaprenyl-diphosphatase
MSRPKAEKTLLLCMAFFVAFLLVAIFRSSLHAIDLQVNLWMPTIQSSGFTYIAAGIDEYFDTNYLVLYAVAIAGIYFVKHQKDKGLLLVGVLAGAALWVSIVKRIEIVARPDNAIVVNPGYSFPSGHTVGIVVLAGVLAFFAWRYWKSRPVRAGICGGFGAMVGLVSFDRVYLNTHWLSDVLGSLLLGASWLLCVILIYRWFEARGSLQGRRFNTIANWLYVGALVLAVAVVVSGTVV